MRTAVPLCSTSEGFGISSVGVRWQLLLRMGSKCGRFVCPVGICVCVCVCAFSVWMWANGRFFSSFSEFSSPALGVWLFSFLSSWHSLNQWSECGWHSAEWSSQTHPPKVPLFILLTHSITMQMSWKKVSSLNNLPMCLRLHETDHNLL